MNESDRQNALKKRGSRSKVTLRQHCQDIYSEIVNGRKPPITPVAGPRRTVTCLDCGKAVISSATRQVLRGENPRARVCVPCSKAA